MIRYPDALLDIEAAVDLEAPNWLVDAAGRTDLYRKLGRYVEEYTDATGAKRVLPPFWGKAKSVYMRRQHNKCIYCETKLEGREFAAVQWDLEHFRPKGRIRRWPGNKSTYAYDFATGDESEAGYYLLAYHLHNYAAACKSCNTSFKSDYFPIAGTRIIGKDNPIDYAEEESFLIYPLGANDEDPEDLITFVGAIARPKYQVADDVRKWRRARVMIDFFGLNRDGLVANRAWWLLYAVWSNYKLAAGGDADARRRRDLLRSERSQFTGCAKCFLAICDSDIQQATAIVSELEKVVALGG